MSIWFDKIKNINTKAEVKRENGEYCGIPYEKWQEGENYTYRWLINNPFNHKGKLVMSIREKILDKMRGECVEYFYLSRSTTKHPIPNEKMLKEMEKDGLFEKRESKFVNSPPYKLYYFYV
jgi:hypothetical protein